MAGGNGGGNIIHQAILYVVNRFMVNRLANSPAFQRFAVRTSKKIEDISIKAAQVKKEVSEHAKDLSETFKNQ